MKVNIVCNSCLHNRLEICTGPSIQIVPFEIIELKQNLIPSASLPRAQSIDR